MRIICWILGHRWINYGGNESKSINLAHLHSRAGAIDLCTRCGKIWDDYYGWVFDYEAEAREYYNRKMNELRRDAARLGLRLWGDIR